MDYLDELLGSADASSKELGEVQLDKSYKADIGKLVNICNLILDAFEAIESIYITPTTIVENALSTIDNITFIVRVKDELSEEEYNEYVENFAELFDSYIQDEYKYLAGKYMLSEIAYGSDIGRQSYILLATRKSLNAYMVELTDMELLSFSLLLQRTDILVNLPNTWSDNVSKTIMIQVPSASNMLEITNLMKRSQQEFGIKFEGPGSMELYSYIPFIGFGDVPFKLPYTRITYQDLDLQRLEELLNPKEGE